MLNKIGLLCIATLGLLLNSCSTDSPSVSVSPKVKTTSVAGDADDCAIWIHPTDRNLSLIIGNDKKGAGGLYGWNLQGEIVFYYGPFIKPINLDIRYGFSLGSEKVDILVVGTHADNTLRVFKIDPDQRKLIDVTIPGGIQTGAGYQIYGLSLYQNPLTGAVSAFVSQAKAQADLIQIALSDNGNGRVQGSILRTFGGKEVQNVVEGMCADDKLGYLYCSDENIGIMKFYAEPERGNDLINRFASNDGIKGDREGLALYQCSFDRGYLILSSQGNNQLKIFDRAGNNQFLMTVNKSGSTKTDGVSATSCDVGPFPHGFVVCHNDENANFVLYDWDEIATDQLLKCSCSEAY
ncbi:MAG: phytase [Verrucomicrobia bacterium]|nr:phytase [Verrucomicrobiota bacterium]